MDRASLPPACGVAHLPRIQASMLATSLLAAHAHRRALTSNYRVKSLARAQRHPSNWRSSTDQRTRPTSPIRRGSEVAKIEAADFPVGRKSAAHCYRLGFTGAGTSKNNGNAAQLQLGLTVPGRNLSFCPTVGSVVGRQLCSMVKRLGFPTMWVLPRTP